MRIDELQEQKPEPEWQRGQQVDWDHFLANLARFRIAEDLPNSVDGVLWLGLAGDKSARGMFSDINRPARIDHDTGGMYPFGDREQARFNNVTGTITVNKQKFPTWDNSMKLHGVIAHELRHRGFHVIRNIPDLLSMMPDEVRGYIRRLDPAKNSVEHRMVYSMDGRGFAHPANKIYDTPEQQEEYRFLYYSCARVAHDWLLTGDLPPGAPQALERELEREFGN